MTKQDKILNQEGKEIEIPESGSLGLLALGALGTKLWREARKKAELERKEQEKNSKKK